MTKEEQIKIKNLIEKKQRDSYFTELGISINDDGVLCFIGIDTNSDGEIFYLESIKKPSPTGEKK